MNTFPKILQRFLLLLFIALVLLGIGTVTRRMDQIREREGLLDTAIPENAPPAVAFTTVALGSFRGLVADFLWLRSAQAKEKGNYFEMVQLASWLVKLQPRFTGATAYLAWNMAYNVSVTFSSFEDRWRWVQRGIELIRDEALVYNPGDPTLYKELGWIYQHKLGQEMDDANRYYKTQLAKQIMTVLGGWPANWSELAEAPAAPGEFRESLGAEHAQGLKHILTENDLTLAELESAFRTRSAFPETIDRELQEAGIAAPTEVYFRKRWLQQVYKLEPRFINELNQRYGELDWRLPEAHALYWASRGLAVAEGTEDIACERMIFQALANAFRSGRLIYVEEADLAEFTPNVNIVDSTNQAYLETMERRENNIGVHAGYENFLIDATVTLYIFGREEKAGDYLGKLREKFDSRKYHLPLNRFVLRELAGDVESATYDQGQAIVQAYLMQMYRALAVGDSERGEAFESLARAIWQRYMEQTAGTERRALPPYKQIKSNMYERCLQTFPPDLKTRLTQAARAYGALPEE